ncbi:MAG: threonine--tRNA ligase [Pseudomonadota bacterium]
MVRITLPDGAEREFELPVIGSEIASAIAPSLRKKAVAMAIDGRLTDLADRVDRDVCVEFFGREDPRVLELIRHDAAHVLAEAVQELFPNTQATIGPVTENGFFYDFARDTPFTPDDLPSIEARMREIIARNEPFTREVWGREQAKDFFRNKGETFKVELIDAIPEGEDIKVYRQGKWLDLCRGPHMTSTGKIGQAFKLTNVAGAYWRGDATKPMLTRIYGTAFATQAELDAHLKMIEEAEKRDHRRLGREMNLYHFQEEAPGSVFWHPKGWTLFQNLIGYMRERQAAAGYIEVNTPDIMDRHLWETSGHWQNYREHMFTTKTEDDRDFALKPMNCPGHMLIYKQGLKSYRDMPLKIAEFGKVHRYEPSGALHGLLRVRSFTQDDAHIFCAEDQLTTECIEVNDLILSIYRDFGFTEVHIKLSTRPEHRIGSDESWDRSEASLKQALDTLGLSYTINEGEGAFYGPKLEYVLRDAIGRNWQCGTLQVDFNLPVRFGAFYINERGEKIAPVMLHRALFGSLERFTGILIEHYAGHFPLWLAPTQVVVATITSDADTYAQEIGTQLAAHGLRAELDLRNEKIPYKVREHSLSKIPVLLVVGKRETAERSVSVRRLGSPATETIQLDQALRVLSDEARRPHSPATTAPAVNLAVGQS